MRSKLLLSAAILLVFVGSFLGQRLLDRSEGKKLSEGRPPERIISLAPSVTETLFALGLGDRVVGVTRYCKYPPEVTQRARVGGYFDPNLEVVVTLQPDLVVMLEEHEQSISAFRKLGLRTLAVRHKDATGILESISTIGDVCGAQSEAREIVDGIQRRLRRIEQRIRQRQTARRARPRVLVVIDRVVGAGKPEDVYVAGSDGFFDVVIELSGGRNAYPPGPARFPVVSAEGILSIDPQVIIDMSPGITADGCDKETALADWRQLGSVEAVRTGRVHAIYQDYAFVPGPRFVLLVEDIARLIHPEADWDKGD